MSSSFSFPRAPGEENMSMAEIFANLPKDIQDTLLKSLTEDQVEELRYDADFWLRPKQMIDGDDWYITALTAGRGFGKLADINHILPTPTGWKKLADIKDGDRVFDENGSPCTVTKAHDVQIPERAYRLLFSDGTEIRAGGEHLWTTWSLLARQSFNRYKGRDSDIPEDWPNWRSPSGIGPSTIDTDELVRTFRYGSHQKLNHSIPLTKPLKYEEKDLPIDPYLYGVYLGDGSKNNGTITSHVEDADWLISMFEARGYPLLSRSISTSGGAEKNCCQLRFKGFYRDLRVNGLLGHKNIPDIYRFGSIEQRMDVLSGILDTDGHIDKISRIEFTAMREHHADFVLEVARSLGQRPVHRTYRAVLGGKDCGVRHIVGWRPTINMFKMPRKVERFIPPGAQAPRLHHRMIVDFEEINPIPMRCLTVDSPNNLFLIGEGMIPTHNTRTGSEWIRKKARENPGCRIALAGRTVADVRNVLVMGDSGILAVSPPDERPEYKQHHASLVWPNGSTALLLSSESPDQARGPQFHYALGDEFAAWRTVPDASGATLYDNLLAATRLGDNPQLVLATTPKRTPVMKDLYERAKDPSQKIRMITGATTENTALSNTYIDNLKRQYGDSDLARQEIEGVMLDDADGIVFSDELIKKSKAYGPRPSGLHYIIAVDPSVAADPKTADECGIMVLGCTRESDPFQRKVYLVEDGSIRAAPDVWADRVVELAKKYRIRDIVAEANQGGALITSIINTRAPHLSVHLVHATKGKIKRVEPVVVAMQQGRIKLAGDFPDLEDQLLFYDPDSSGYSPDRMDAFAWGVTALVISPPKTLMFSTVRAFSPRLSAPPASRTIDSMKSSHTRRSLPSR